MGAYRELTSTQQLAELCDLARSTGRLGLDTEFLWERTYSPQLCLAQINVDGDVAIADPLDGVSLAPLAEVIGDPDVQIVMHAPHADLVGFALRHDARPVNVFDTQIAAGFVGLSAGLAYDRLVEEIVGVRLPSSESFTDWSRRPLTTKQLQYAADDVEHLFDLVDEIVRRLRDQGRLDWANEELDRRFGAVERFVTRPEDAWRKVGRRGKLRGNDLGVLREVAAWRERLARHRDIPVSWVVKDPSLVELARRKPRTAKDLTRVRGVDGSLKEQDRRELLAAIERGLDQRIEGGDASPALPRAVRKRVTIAKGLAAALLRARCEQAGIAAELVGTSQDVEDLIGHVALGAEAPSEAPALLRGWRERFGRDLVDLVNGELTLRLVEDDPYLLIER